MDKKRRTKNEMWRRIVGMMLAFAMVLSSLPIVGYETSVDAYAEEIVEDDSTSAEDGEVIEDDSTTSDDTEVVEQFTEEDCASGEVYYTLAGGVNDWNPKNKANQMTETIWDGVYLINIDVPAFNEEEEWLNKFKICKIDDVTVSGSGWNGCICLGTTVADDNQTYFRIENEEALTDVSVYFDSNTGAVVMKDSFYGDTIDYKFSWVGYEAEAGYTTVSEFATCGITWPADKIKVDKIPKIAEGHSKLYAKITGQDLADESLYTNGKVKYTIAGGCSPFAWGTTSSANEMKESYIPGIYEIKLQVPAYDEAAEWNNRFKILRLDDITYCNGWLGSLCLGTDVYDDNQTTFRIENEEAMEVTVYLDSLTGAVVMMDSNDKEVDYKFSWVGYDNEVQYTTVSGFATCGYTWPEDKLKVDEEPSIEEVYEDLLYKLSCKDLSDELLYKDGTVFYTVAGGCTPVAWDTTSVYNKMYETAMEGVYKIKLSVSAYDETAEWNNRFKILCLDYMTCMNGWMGNICLGTNTYADNQTMFRIENEKAMDVTVYFEPATGAVVMLDSNWKEVNYKFSWVGYDSEVQYTTVSEFATCGYTWPSYYVFVDEIPDIKGSYDNLLEKLLYDYDLETDTANQKVTYHFYNVKGWDNVGAWVKQSIDWSQDCMPLDKCVLKDTTDGSRPNEPIYPGAKMEAEGGGWYKITCSYSAPEKGSMMIFNNYVGDSRPGDTTSEADIQKLRDAGIVLNDVAIKEQTPNIMIKKNGITSNEYWITWDGNSNGAQIVLGRSDMIKDTAPSNYKPGFGCSLTVNGSKDEQAVLKDDFVILEPSVLNATGQCTYKYVMEDVLTGEIKVLKNYSTSPMYIYKVTTLGTKKFMVYVKDENGMIYESNAVTVVAGGLVGNLVVNRSLEGMKHVVGDYALLEVSATGGSGEYTYKYVMEDVATGKIEVLKNYSSITRHIAMLSSAGVKNLKAYVKDSSGTEVLTNVVTIEVEEVLSAALKVNGSTSKVTTKEGDTIKLNAEANGGSGGYLYKFEELNVETGEVTLLSDFSVEAEYSYVTKGEGTYHLMVTVEDSNGNIAEAIIMVSIYGTGWKQIGDKMYYINDKGVMVTKWKQIDGDWYYFDTNGVMQTSRWIAGRNYVKADGKMAVSEIVEGKYYVGADGLWEKTTGWKEVDGNWYYFTLGIMQKSKWIGNKYYVKADGTMATSEFVDNGNYYVNEDGVWVSTTRWLQIDGSWYYLKAGTVQKSKWVKVGTDYYYFDANGVMQTSRWVSGKYYVKEDGKMAVSEWVDGGKYYVGEDGVWVQGA
ncbi:MAG: hypothetical protein IJA34_06040 [Lachnospiraceae bacterium]|nr:hypothetical protein [Lachnospiraceae bacterium]